jgi:hypothetical protein
LLRKIINELRKIEFSFGFEKAIEPSEVVTPFHIRKTALTKNNKAKENETSKMKFKNGDDHCFLKFLKTNFTPVNYTVFTK